MLVLSKIICDKVLSVQCIIVEAKDSSVMNIGSFRSSAYSFALWDKICLEYCLISKGIVLSVNSLS